MQEQWSCFMFCRKPEILRRKNICVKKEVVGVLCGSDRGLGFKHHKKEFRLRWDNGDLEQRVSFQHFDEAQNTQNRYRKWAQTNL